MQCVDPCMEVYADEVRHRYLVGCHLLVLASTHTKQGSYIAHGYAEF